MRKTMLAALLVTAASVLTVPAFAQDAAAATKAEASATTTGAAAKDATKATDQAASKTGETAHKAAKHSAHKAKAAPTDASKTDAAAPGRHPAVTCCARRKANPGRRLPGFVVCAIRNRTCRTASRCGACATARRFR